RAGHRAGHVEIAAARARGCCRAWYHRSRKRSRGGQRRARNRKPMIFPNRTDAGKQLADALDFLRGRDDVIVLAIPRGGVVVGYEVARALGAPLDLWFSHKIGAPGNPEFAIGSVSVTGNIEIDAEVTGGLGV